MSPLLFLSLSFSRLTCFFFLKPLPLSQDDDEVSLCPETLAALKDFISEQSRTGSSVPATHAISSGLSEDWHLSQFWYSEATASFLAREALRCSSPCGRIACLSTPTLYRSLKKLGCDRAVLFEFDRRFSCFGDEFVFYDLYKPNDLPDRMQHSFDFVCADPPHLNRETVANILVSASLLARSKSTPILLLTSAALESVVLEITGRSLVRQAFVPKHEGSRLQNPFASFSNFTLGTP